MRATAHLLILLICGAVAPSLAQELAIGGRIVDPDGRPATGVDLRLVPILSPFDQTALELSGSATAEATARARTDEYGGYRLMAPEAGFWRLLAQKPGHAEMEYAFRQEPLVNAVTLPELELLPARRIRVAVEDPTGKPAGDGWIEAWVTGATPQRVRQGLWRLQASPVKLIAGAAEVFVPDDHDVELQAWRRGYLPSSKTQVKGTATRLRLRVATPRRLLVADSAGNTLSGALIKVGEVEWPATRTGADGTVTLHGAADSAQARILLADGRKADVRLKDGEGLAGAAFEFRVADARTVSGRVVDAETQRPVAGAFVYPLRAIGRFVKSDARGGFLLDGLDQDPLTVSAAASGYLPGRTRTGAATTALTIGLAPATDLPGMVVDAAGDPLAAVEVVARPYGDSMRGLYRSPSRQTTSDDSGQFVLPRLKADVPYSVAARLDGFAPSEAIVRDLSSTARAGLTLKLESGTLLSGRIVAPDGRGVAGAGLTLERAEASEAMRYLSADPRQPRPFRFEFSTDQEGEFSFADTPVGEFNLQVQARGFALEALPIFEVEAGMRTHDLGIITLEPGVELAGRVLDDDGVPLNSAKVTIRTRREVVFPGGLDPDLQQLSGADGYFSFSDRRRGEFVDLVVELTGYASKDLPRVAVPPDDPFEIALEPAVTLRGRILDPDGAPIANATVLVGREGGGSSYGGRVFTQPDAWGRADELGRFEVADIKPGTVRVSAEAEGWLATSMGEVELMAGVEPADLDIELKPGATVSGRVIGPDGTPLSEASIRVQDSTSMRSSRTASDGDGRYTLGGVEPGKRMISAHHEGLQATQELEVEPGDNPLDFYFEPGIEISGSVVSPQGDPVEGAVLSLAAPGVYSYGGGGNSARSDAGGEFRFENVAPGVFAINAEHPDYGPATPSEPIEVGAAPISGLQIQLADGVELTGSILGATPEELASVELVAIRQPAGPYKAGRTDSNGGYRIANLSPGSWKIWVRCESGRQTSDHIDIAEGETRVNLDLEFEDGLVLSGRVVNQGEPLAGAWIMVAGADTGRAASAQTDHEGRFRLTGLEAGTYSLRVTDFMSGVSHGEEIELRRDDEVVIELTEGAAIAGQVTARRGRAALSGVSVILEAVVEGDAPLAQIQRGASTDAGGRFRLSDLAPGRYRIRASKAGYAAQSRTLDVTDEEIDGADFALEEVEGLGLTVLSPSGAPAAHIAYAVLDLAGAVIQSGNETATNEGLVRLGTVPDGDWVLMIEAPGAALRKLRTQAPKENLTVRLERAAALAIRVEELLRDTSTVATLRITGADGLPFKALSWNRGTSDQWRLGAGRLTLDHLPAGRWILSITTADGRGWERSVSLDAGANDEVVFD